MFVTTGRMSAYQVGFQPVRARRQRLDWTLTEIQTAAGNTALRMPPNRVLRLKNSPSYVNLPPHVFDHLTEATIEAWVKLDRIKPSWFFGYGDRTEWIGIGTGPPDGGDDFNFGVSEPAGKLHFLDLPGGVKAGSWYYAAAVTSPGGMKLYVNAMLVATNADPIAFSGSKNGNFLRLGQKPGDDGSAQYLEGELDEVRVWSRERTAEEIRGGMFAKLAGNERGLAALWTFDDPAEPGRDASTNRIDGKLIGEAQTVEKELPALVFGQIVDPAGKPLPGASVEVRQPGRELQRFTADDSGEYTFTIDGSERCDLFVTTGKMSAYQVGFQPVPTRRQRLDWTLSEIQSAREPTALGPPRNRVLRLKKSPSYVDLPPSVFDHLTQATVEAWVKLDRMKLTHFFCYGDFPPPNLLSFGIVGPPVGGEDELAFGVYHDGGLHYVKAQGVTTAGSWCHVAGVTTSRGLKLYVNGQLVASNSDPFALFAAAKGNSVRLGHIVGDSTKAQDNRQMDGEMDEVRVWSRERSAEEIRGNMFTRLTGREQGLAALWNFDDPAQPARDASPNHIDGRLVGEAQTLEEDLPPLASIFGRITDASGKTLAGAKIELRQPGRDLRSFTADTAGEYALTIDGTERCDLFITTGKLSASRLGFQPIPATSQQLDWTLAELQGAPATPGERRDAGTAPRRAEDSWPSQLTEAINHVLQLDGDGSYVELPPNMFNGLEEATVEAWVNWASFREHSRPFDFGEAWHSMHVQNLGRLAGLRFDISAGGPENSIEILDLLRTNQWVHVAAVSGKAGMKLYVNGALAGTNEFRGSFAALQSGKYAFLGRSTWENNPSVVEDFHGQLDEVRVWKVGRSESQIRENRFKQLVGNEPDLVGLWNFDDPTDQGRDSTRAGHHGKLRGRAKVIAQWSIGSLYGRISDSRGNALARASIEVRQSGGETVRATSDAHGDYLMTVDTSKRCDLFVTTGKLSAYRLGFQPSGEARQKLDWTLTETQGAAERVPTAQFPAGTVVAKTLTDETGAFDFANVKPGLYQLRAQVLSGKSWFDAGRPLSVQDVLPGAEAPKLKPIDWRLAPFKKGHWTTYTARDGLPSNHIRKFWVDPDGLLWIATDGGVSRFDGKDFSNLTTEDGLLNDRVFNLWRQTNGVWWFCTARGVSRYEPALATQGRRAFRNFTGQDGLAAGAIHAVTQTPDGVMWFAGNPTGVARFDGEKFFTYPPRGDFTNINYTTKMTATTAGVLWIGTSAGLIRFDGDNFVNVTKVLGIETPVDSPTVVPDESIWFGGSGFGNALVALPSGR